MAKVNKIDKKIDKKNVEKEESSSEIVRKFKQNPVLYTGSILILVLVIITFLGGDLFSGLLSPSGGDLTFGYYDKAPISWVPGNMFAQYQEQLVRYYQSQGIDVNDIRASADIWRQAYELTVVHTAVLQVMKRSKYTVPEKTVDREVARLPHFQENGRFSAALYNQMPESSRHTLWRQVQEDLTKMMYFGDFYGLLMPSAEADFIGMMASQMRTFEVVFFKVDNYPEAEYQAYARENADLFRSIHLSKITVNTNEREAKRILDSIKNGTTTFEDAARAQSQDALADRGGDMGSSYSFELEAEIPNPADREVVLNLRRGEMSDVIRAGDRWVFFRVEDELKPPNFEDFAVMDRVRAYLRNFDRGRMEDWAIAQARDFIGEAQLSGLDEALSSRNMEKHSIGPLPINYAGVDLFTPLESFAVTELDLQDLQFMSRNENFWRTAFSTPLETFSEPLVQGNNVLVLIPIEQINAEETLGKDIASIYESYWVNLVAEQSMPYYFLSNERMDDRFWDVYFQYFLP